LSRLVSISLQLVLLATLTSNVAGGSWHGITPLHSSRTDVENLWGKPLPPPSDSGRAYTLNDNRSIYFTDEGEVYVLYARFTTGCDKSVTADTVLWVSLTPKRRVLLSNLGIDTSRFRIYDPSTPRGIGYKAYSDEANGYELLTFKGVVEEIYYQPTAVDRKLCPTYFEGGAPIRFTLLIHSANLDRITGFQQIVSDHARRLA
jgi:hypothetical protein